MSQAVLLFTAMVGGLWGVELIYKYLNICSMYIFFCRWMTHDDFSVLQVRRRRAFGGEWTHMEGEPGVVSSIEKRQGFNSVFATHHSTRLERPTQQECVLVYMMWMCVLR